MSYKKLLTFAIGSYLMLRIDYVVICRDELEAKILRIIEMYMEMERARIYQETVNGSTGETDEDIEITKDIWVAISHRLFTRDLYQLVKSENTLKRAIKSLADKGFIFIRPGTGKHDPILYQLNTAKLQAEFEKLSQLGIVGYQKLIPSKIDTSKSDTHEGSKNRHHQTLTPSKNDPHSRIVSSSRIDGTSSNGNEEEGTGASAQTPPLAANVSDFLSESAKLRAMKTAGVASVAHSQTAHEELPPDIEDWDDTSGLDSTQRMPAIGKGDDHALVHGAGHNGADSGNELAGDGAPARTPVLPAGDSALRHAHLAVADSGHAGGQAQPVASSQTVRGATGLPQRSQDGAAPLAGIGTSPPFASASQPRASGVNDPPRQLTRKQQEKLYDGIKAEYWAVIEAWKGALYTRDQRNAASHTSGIDAMLANGVLPDDLRAKLGKLDAFQRRTFTVNKLYLDWWNNLDEQVPAKPASNGKPSRTAYDGQTDLNTYGFGQNDEAQIAKFTKLGAAS